MPLAFRLLGILGHDALPNVDDGVLLHHDTTSASLWVVSMIHSEPRLGKEEDLGDHGRVNKSSTCPCHHPTVLVLSETKPSETKKTAPPLSLRHTVSSVAHYSLRLIVYPYRL